ncbi:MAG: c-type cytochrome [Mariprofundaceae bacterium]|nr:c-type cytochrome [Mariprofundaceae bacterium]
MLKTQIHIQFSTCMLALLLLVGCSSEQEPTSSDAKGMVDLVKIEMMPGGTVVRKRCANCHFLDKRMRKVGPSLMGIYMRAPSIADVPFEVWDEKSLAIWLKDPIGVKPKTAMAISGLRDPEELRQVIAYLKKI